MVALDQRHLGDCKTHGQRNHPERLERDPDIGALGTPDDFIQDRHREKEQCPAHREDAPAQRCEIEHLIEHDGDEGATEQQPAAEDRGEQAVNDGRLDLDKSFIVQHQRQRAEHDDDDAGDQRHHGHVPRYHIRHDQRGNDRHHEGAGGHEQIELGVRREKHDQRPEFGRKLEQRVRGGFVHHSIHFVASHPSRRLGMRAFRLASPSS